MYIPIADSVLLSLFMSSNGKCNVLTPPPPPSTGLSSIQSCNLKCHDIHDLEGPEVFQDWHTFMLHVAL